ncbi:MULTISPECIES: sugar phosphate isomerase/epimerase [unclassified Curtobacterium]|uniref:sugar phosphate isomerase/epimerase family protein n=1 Tax=unclassified Curtobacterium TaxID=257496 RepID=UPI000F4763C7|nr:MULTISPECIES: TIM barrel protein [unclassified Curtobacterium]ROQ16851.1 sugar phosphate isomerase/epimerase [Curtobacterium sp. PhB171]ROQ25072.1 sugar phosphate isomerase/epimerase [Curtobacterium sp. PhB170]ROS36523.1 sugar phosphate isomerase/epimerase [Curtobacterium sp. PhB131]ROS71201.1 sugar phosphate isomerase/epimerase [Curtobacterium sp. PhB141]
MEHDLLATSWTWAGDEPIRERVHAVSAAGFAGLSLSLDDLHQVRATTGFAELRRMLDGAGIVWVQLGPLDRWWTCTSRTDDAAADRGVVLEAAAALRAWQVIARADTTLPGASPITMADDWTVLADQAAAVGAQLVLEPEPWSNLPTIERASRFVAAAGHPNGGLLLDAMHTLRGGSTLASIRQAVAPATLAAVELSDGLLHTPAGMTLSEEAREARYLPGAGAWDLPGLVRTVRELGFDEPWGVEVRTPGHRAMPTGDALRTAAAATRAVLDAADAYGAPAAPAMPSSPAPTSAVDFEPPHPRTDPRGRTPWGSHRPAGRRDADTGTPA